MDRHIGKQVLESKRDSAVPDRPIACISVKRSISYLFERAMVRQGISRADVAIRMGTSRAVVNRLLDPENDSLTLATLQKAAEALGLTLTIDLQ